MPQEQTFKSLCCPTSFLITREEKVYSSFYFFFFLLFLFISKYVVMPAHWGDAFPMQDMHGDEGENDGTNMQPLFLGAALAFQERNTFQVDEGYLIGYN